MYQQIYDFGNSPQQSQQSQQQEEEDNKESVFYNQQNNNNHVQYNSPLAGTYTLRYPQFHSFDQQLPQQSQEQQILNNTTNDSIHNFSSYHHLTPASDLVDNYTSVFMNNTSSALPPLNTTPIVVAPLQHHPTTSHQTYLLAQKKPLKGSPRPSRERAPWTPEEDNLLKLAVQLYGDKTEKWAKIAACVPGRTNKNCRKRWFHSLDPSLRKGAWTEEEDQLLREGVSRFPNQWSKIADMLPGRTDDQCAKRWRESLDPSIDRSEWTPNEDKLLMEKYEEYGSQWQKIAFFFEGRPGLHCRNRWRKLQRMVQVKKEKEEASMNAPFFNTLAEGQTLRFQHAPEATFQQQFVNALLPQQQAQQLQHLQQSQQLQQQQQQQQQQDASHVLAQFAATANTTTNNSNVSDEFEYGDGIKPYGCDVPGCYAVFPSSSGLFYHMKNTHPNLEGISKPYRCAMVNCSKKYKNINGLQYHIKEAKGTTGHGSSIIGEDDRPYRCTIGTCKKAYRTSNGFRYHQQNGHQIQQQEPQQFRMKRMFDDV